jgi:hypothetical protein
MVKLLALVFCFSLNTQAALFNVQQQVGTWTPTLSGTTLAGAGTYSIQQGQYIKTGKMVWVAAYISITNHSGTGNFVLGGLPFTSVSTANHYSTCAIGYVNNLTTVANSTPAIYVNPGATSMELTYVLDAGGAAGAVAVDTSFGMMFSCTYQAAN